VVDDSVFANYPGRRPWWYRNTIFATGESRSEAADWWYGGAITEEDEISERNDV